MDADEFKDLDIGDIVRHVHNGIEGIWVVTGNYGGRVTAAQTVDMTNPNEWEVISKSKLIKP